MWGPGIKPQPLRSFFQVPSTASVPSEGKELPNRSKQRNVAQESGLQAEETQRGQTASHRAHLLRATVGPQLKRIFQFPF